MYRSLRGADLGRVFWAMVRDDFWPFCVSGMPDRGRCNVFLGPVVGTVTTCLVGGAELGRVARGFGFLSGNAELGRCRGVVRVAPSDCRGRNSMTAGDMVGTEDKRVSFFVWLAMVLEVIASFKRFVFRFRTACISVFLSRPNGRE